MLMAKSFEKHHHLFERHILVTICFFMIEIQVSWIWRHFNLTNKTFTKKDIVYETAWNIKDFPTLFFNHFIQPSPPPIFKRSLERSSAPPKMVPSLCALTKGGTTIDDFKISPNLYALPSPINMTTMIKQHTTFLPTHSSPRQTSSPGYSLPHC